MTFWFTHFKHRVFFFNLCLWIRYFSCGFCKVPCLQLVCCMKVFCCLAILVTHKPISFVFRHISFVKLIPRLWKMAEDEGTGMRILQGAFIICVVVLDYLVAKIRWSVEAEKKRTNASPNTRHGCHPQTSTPVLAIASRDVQSSDCGSKSSTVYIG